MFDLKIYFTGVMLFVPEDEQMHVLLPQTSEFVPAQVLRPAAGGAPADAGHAGHDGAHPVEPHVARMTFDTAYTRPGAETQDGAIAHVSLRETLLKIPAVGDAYQRGVPAEITRVPRPVRRDVLDGTDRRALVARVLVARGQATEAGLGFCWDVKGEVRRMAHQLEWTVSGIDDDHLELETLGLEAVGAFGAGVPRLYPIGGTVELFIWHAPAFEIPPGVLRPAKPQPGDRNHHFSHLDDLLEPAREGETEIPMPVFVAEDCPDAGGAAAGGGGAAGAGGSTRGRDPDKGGASLTCTPGTTG